MERLLRWCTLSTRARRDVKCPTFDQKPAKAYLSHSDETLYLRFMYGWSLYRVGELKLYPMRMAHPTTAYVADVRLEVAAQAPLSQRNNKSTSACSSAVLFSLERLLVQILTSSRKPPLIPMCERLST